MNVPTVHPATWIRLIQSKVHQRPSQDSPFTKKAIVNSAEENLQGYLKRAEKKIIRKANRGCRIFATISGHSEYRIMFFYEDKNATKQFIKVPHRTNKLYSSYAPQNQDLYNKTYLEAACRELGLELNTTDYVALPFNQ
jgi:hypothetical protein